MNPKGELDDEETDLLEAEEDEELSESGDMEDAGGAEDEEQE